MPGAPLRGLVDLVGGFAVVDGSDETPVEQIRNAVPPQPPCDVLNDPGHAAGPDVAAGGGSIVCTGTRAALQPFRGAAG